MTSAKVKERLLERYGENARRMHVLPPYHNLNLWRDTQPTLDLKKRYPSFQFLILTIADFPEDRNITTALASCASVLRQYATVALVVVGGSRYQETLEKYIEEQELTGKVILEPMQEDVLSHMKTADVLLNVSDTEESEVLLVEAAAASLPIITVASNAADTFFEDGVSAFICPESDVECLSTRVNEFLNRNQLRKTLAINARNRVFVLIDQNEDAYLGSLVDIFETCAIMHQNKT